MRCSSCQRSAPDSPRSRRSSSACASSSCARARASSTSAARTASSTSAIARSSSTLKKPGPVAYSRTSSPVWTRVEPAFSVATSGACRARTPISPAAPGTTIISASPSKAGPSGVTRETSKRRLGSLRLLFALLWLLLLAAAAEPLRLLDRLLDRADHVEGLLGQLVVLAVEDLREALDRVLELHVLAGRAGELLGDEVRLREEALHLPRSGDDEPVLVRELVDAEDGDDVLEVLVALEHLLDAGRRPVVVVGDDPRLEGARERVERVHRRVDALLHYRAGEHRRRVEVGEGIGRRRVGEVVGRPGTTIISASPSKAGPSGVTRETSKRRLGSLRLLFALLWLLLLAAAAEPLRLLDRLLDRADHVEGLLGQLVVLAVEDLREALDRVLELHVLAGRAGELLGDEVRLREEALHLPRPGDDEPVLVRELVDAEDGDDVLEVLVALEHLLDAGRRPVVVVGDDPRLEGARERVERVHRRVDALLHDRAGEHRRRIEVGEGVRRRRVGVGGG